MNFIVRLTLILLIASLLRPSALAQSQTWAELAHGAQAAAPASFPPKLYAHSAAYDSVRQRHVLVGGAQPNPAGTWEFDGCVWSYNSAQPSVLPIECPATFDAARAETVLFSNQGASQPNITTVYNGVNWITRTPSTQPPARFGYSITYHAPAQQVVLFGGEDSAGNKLNDLWLWDGSDWYPAPMAPSSPIPPARSHAGMAYDPQIDLIVLNGGLDANTFRSDTWLLNLTPDGWAWTDRPTGRQTARATHTLAFDGQQIVMFGGITANGVVGDVLYWNYLIWQSPNDTGGPAARFPSARFNATMSYDSVRLEALLFGGVSTSAFPDQAWRRHSFVPTSFVETFAPGCPDSLQRAPRILSDGCPNINTTTNYVIDQLPGGTTMIVMGLDVPAAPYMGPIGTCVYHLMPQVTFSVSPANPTFPIAIPNDPSLRGSDFYLQGVIDDGTGTLIETTSVRARIGP